MIEHPKVRVSCADCGDRWANNITLSRCTTNGQWSYSFYCEACGKRTVRNCGEKIASLVLQLEPVLRTWTLPVVEMGSGPAICWDDVLDAVAFLHSPAFDEARARDHLA